MKGKPIIRKMGVVIVVVLLATLMLVSAMALAASLIVLGVVLRTKQKTS